MQNTTLVTTTYVKFISGTYSGQMGQIVIADPDGMAQVQLKSSLTVYGHLVELEPIDLDEFVSDEPPQFEGCGYGFGDEDDEQWVC